MNQPPFVPVENPNPEQAELLAELRQVKGGDLNIFLTLAHHPTLLRRFRALSGMFRTEGKLPHTLQEVVVLRTAWRAGSHYILARHAVVALAAGLSEDDILTVLGGHGTLSDPAAALCMEASDQAWDNQLSPSLLRTLGRHLTTEQLLEVPILAGFYRMVCGFVKGFDVRLEPDVRLPAKIQQQIDTRIEGREPEDA